MMPPPAVRPSEMRPRRLWFWIGGALIVLGLLGGIAGFIVSLFNLVALPEFSAEFRDGEQAVFGVPAIQGESKAWLLYTDVPMSESEADSACTVEGPDSSIAFSRTYDQQSTVNGEHWERAAMISIDEPGEYTIECSGGPAATYGVALGERSLGSGFALLALSAGAPVVIGIGSGAAAIIITAVRRSKNRKRLLAQRRPI